MLQEVNISRNKTKLQGNLCYLYYGHDGCVNVYCGRLVPLFEMSMIPASAG